ncbi:MAG: XTP/dITP diphosphatase [Nitrospirae bacterium]|nr:XTP/dITP diphosphatase [Nitrospirota bacterium]
MNENASCSPASRPVVQGRGPVGVGPAGREIVIATTNAGKVREIRAVLDAVGWTVNAQSDFGEMPEVREDGLTYAANAVKKAQAAAARLGLTALGDDSGLEVDALDGAPGLYSARFAGAQATDAQNRRLLLDRLRETPRSQWGARFRCVMALISPRGASRVVEGVVEGQIGEEETGDGGFGYDPVFVVDCTGRTFAELPSEEKNRISHRAHALAQICDILIAEPAVWQRGNDGA